MAELTRAEQERVDYADALENAYRRGERFYTTSRGDKILVNESQVERAREIADNQRRNAELRAERLAMMHAERSAQRAAHEQQQEAEVRQHLRSLFPGTDREFDAAYPELKQRWQIEQALHDDPVARKRASMFEGF